MNLTRYNPAGRLLLMAMAIAALLDACESPRTALNPAGISDQKIGDICAGKLGYDVTGPYYARCMTYLRGHGQAQRVAVSDRSEPAAHQACQEIGLTRDTPDYKNCVQELNLLDISEAHL